MGLVPKRAHLWRAFIRLAFFPLGVISLATVVCAEESPSFVRDIRPLLSRHCFACHGPDEAQRQGELRLDIRDAAIEASALSPGEPDESELVRRVFSDDPEQQMPPADVNTQLTPSEKRVLRDWIAAGAKYEKHWAFDRPTKPALPEVMLKEWPRNDIDRFVLARLEKANLRPAQEANDYTLIRRLYLDLIGLPPILKMENGMIKEELLGIDIDPTSYPLKPAESQAIIDRLFDSPHYGERWARQWLDLARYSDTNGYEKDRPRSIWPYRDWVIKALNDDMPFDQFTVEQIAGDMLPGATNQQRIATGFHRNTMLNEEGGIDPLEYRFYAMVDRVATTGTVWMGLTTGCAQCHSHKYDPLSHTDYYRLMAMLNNADEPDLIVSDSAIRKQRERIQQQITKLEAGLADQFPPADGDEPIAKRRHKTLDVALAAWIESQKPTAWTVLQPSRLSTNLPKLETLKDGSIYSSGDITKRDVFTLAFPLDRFTAPITALRLEVLPDARLPAGGPGRAYYEGRKGDFFLSEVMASVGEKAAPFSSGSHSFGKISIGSGSANAANVFDGDGSTGWATAGREGESHQLVLRFAEPIDAAGELAIEMVFERHFAASLGRFRISATSRVGDVKASTLPVEVESLLAAGADSWSLEQRQQVRQYFLSISTELADARKPIDQLRRTLSEFAQSMVMLERPADNPRQTSRHHRGEYLSPRETVTAGLPQLFIDPESAANGAEPLPTDRLSLARWLASERNPLVARVTVNRAWRSFFGAGLMRSSDDFGTQSEPPTHPELLDWLACEFMERGWSVKTLHRLIVTSATYRQDSRITPKLHERDPQNRLLARGPRYRVDAEVLRDMMLAASGLLTTKIGGPSVYPPQPAGVTALAYGNTKWATSTGPDRFRRSLYTFSKRTAPFAAYTTFDGPTGENCLARRDRSNTPLQALTLLNDGMFLELARGLAGQTMKLSSTKDRAEGMLRRLMTRQPTDQELDVVIQYFHDQEKRLNANELDAAKIGGKDATAEFAAWVMTARAVMNLDEVITKE